MAARHNAIFVDVDTQFDFMDPAGALYVPGAERIVPNLRRLFAAAIEHAVPIVSTADYHAPDDPEFADFPPHCVRGTPGQLRPAHTLMPDRATLDPDESAPAADLLDRHAQVVFHKRTIDVWTSAGLQRLRREIAADAWYVFGVATDYCVKSAALGLARAGQPTYVVTDAIRAIGPQGERQAFEEMTAAGVRPVTTDEVIRSLAATAAGK